MSDSSTIVVTLFREKLEKFEQKINVATNSLADLKEALARAQFSSNAALSTLVNESNKGECEIEKEIDDEDDSEEDNNETDLMHKEKIQKTK